MADSLLFDDVDDTIALSMGTWVASGAYTQILVIKRLSIAGGDPGDVLSDLNGTTGVTFLLGEVGDTCFYTTKAGVDDRPTSDILVPIDQWMLLAFGKQAGSDVGRFHAYNWNTSAWSHYDGTAGSTDNAGNTSLQISRNDYPTSMNLLIAGVWDSELSDGQIETLITGKAAWSALSPREAWRFDTASSITSFAGTSTQASRTGTTVDTGDAPAGWADGQTVLPDADLAAGGWTTSPLFSKLNDASDATVITATAS